VHSHGHEVDERRPFEMAGTRPQGIPHTRVVTHAPMKRALAEHDTRSRFADGRITNSSARPIWSQPAVVNAMPKGSHSAAWLGTIATWITLADPESVASNTRAGMLNGNTEPEVRPVA